MATSDAGLSLAPTRLRRQGRKATASRRVAPAVPSTPPPSPRDRLATALDDNAAQLAALGRQHDEIVAASRDSNADDEHDPEGATIAWERSQVGALIREAEAQLAEIDAALVRIDSGGYGVCERCAEPIPAERLEARPAARRCVGCASRP